MRHEFQGQRKTRKSFLRMSIAAEWRPTESPTLKVLKFM